MPISPVQVTVTMSNDYVQNFTMSFGNFRTFSKIQILLMLVWQINLTVITP